MEPKGGFALENQLLDQGFRYICGIDEAGRGCLCGPVVAGACILDPKSIPEGINDSKKLSAIRRESLFAAITESALAWNYASVDNKTIDRVNILEATKIAMAKAARNLPLKPDILLIDALRINNLQMEQRSYIKGDEEVVSIGAASIIAKVCRDRIMLKYHHQYPQYNLESNKGYPTKEHREALREYGPSKIHRRTFNGVLKFE